MLFLDAKLDAKFSLATNPTTQQMISHQKYYWKELEFARMLIVGEVLWVQGWGVYGNFLC